MSQPSPTPGTVTMATEPNACLLHGDYHPLGVECRDAVTVWEKSNDHLEPDEISDTYESAVERSMLDRLARGRQL